MQLIPKIENIIKSPLFLRLNVVVEGTIGQIKDQTLVITKERKSLTIITNEEICISVVRIPKLFHKQHSFSSSNVGYKKIDFKTLEVGDYVKVFAEIMPDGSIKGRTVTLIIFLE